MKSILIDSDGEYLRTAMTEDGKLVDLVVDKKSCLSVAGNIYLGLVKNILPNEFTFVDIGQQKNAFLNGAEIKNKSALRVGQAILVQARKDPTGEKGASLSARLDITGRLTVLYEHSESPTGVSHKIKSAAERERLKQILKKHLPEGFGVIARTSSENKSEEEILEDLTK